MTGTSWAVVASITLAFSILGLIGASGIYWRQVEEAGVLGLVGYVMYAAFFLLTTVFTFAETFIGIACSALGCWLAGLRWRWCSRPCPRC